MHAGRYIIAAFFSTIGVLYRSHADYQSPLYCQRLVAPLITTIRTVCTYPCLLVSPEGIPSIVVLPEPDGTLCKVGRCRGGACLELWNYGTAKTFVPSYYIREGGRHHRPDVRTHSQSSKVRGDISAGSTSGGLMDKITTTPSEGQFYIGSGITSATSMISSGEWRLPSRRIKRLREKRRIRGSYQVNRVEDRTMRQKVQDRLKRFHKKRKKPHSHATNNGNSNGGQDVSGSNAGGKRKRLKLPPGAGLMLGMAGAGTGIQLAAVGAQAGIRSSAQKAAAAKNKASTSPDEGSSPPSDGGDGGADGGDNDNTGGAEEEKGDNTGKDDTKAAGAKPEEKVPAEKKATGKSEGKKPDNKPATDKG
ncbi:uncharacterized protein LOC119445578 isoform X2 [Dermacentor silvarum]|uniref:uncharacterized protein LOC119445578 isoform X2 n=1 Tax=Dermacentor silvarum TaxID=543639 RepID=UPI00189A0684|nr:uncharacterized protein LOC119445578 isoform X2 [Dermacentor silvarum]